jgi:hypothetical protein
LAAKCKNRPISWWRESKTHALIRRSDIMDLPFILTILILLALLVASDSTSQRPRE